LTAIGEAVAPLLTVAIVSYTDNRFPFLVFTVIALCCGVMFLRLKPEHVPSVKKSKRPISFSYASSVAIIHKIGLRSLFLLFMGFFVAFFWESVWFSQPLVGVYEDSLINAALIVAAFSLPTIIFSKPLGLLIDAIGEKKVFFYSISLIVASFFAFYVSSLLLAKIIFIFLAAVGVLGLWLVLDVLSVKINEAGQRGEFFGILETVRDASYAIAPLFIGFSYKAIGLNGVFLVNSIIACLLLFFGVLIFKRKTVY
jgi:MFS family permease